VPYTPSDNFRDVPDVSLSASAAIMPYVVSYSWTAADGDAQAPQPEALTAVGGTSAATPSFAGILALVNQALATANPSAPVGLGNANPMLYALANNAATAGAFHDVTTGNNIVPCQSGSPSCPASAPFQFGYTAGPGYDQVTGLGTIDGANLVAAWKALTPTSTTLVANETGTTEGSPLTLTATIASQATSNLLTGSVTFYFETFDGQGNIDLSGNLGSVVVTASSSPTEGATAMLSTKAPAGFTGMAKIGAFYGGDTHYLASWSSLSSVTATSTLVVCPTTVTLLPDQTGFTFTATGGGPPISWSVLSDSTCARVNKVETCSTISDAGVFTAGPTAGTALVSALDTNYSYVTATVTVAGAADAGTPLPVVHCMVADAGTDGAVDSGAKDGSSPSDASTATDSAVSMDSAMAMDAEAEGGNGGGSSSSGCGCVTAGGDRAVSGAWLGASLLGLAVTRRRRARRGA
jgi:MYXO-CTERM domain-containing protein